MAERKASRRSTGRGKTATGREAWHRILRLSRRILREIDARLDVEHRMSVHEFDILITLDNAPDRRLRMTSLAQSAMLSSGGLTRLVGRLEDRGLVERIPDSDDGRSFHAALTEAGSRRLAEARVTHDEVIGELLSAKLTAAELQSFTRALARALER